MTERYELLHVEVQKMRGTREGVKSIFDAIIATLPSTKNNSYILKLDLKECIEAKLNLKEKAKE